MLKMKKRSSSSFSELFLEPKHILRKRERDVTRRNRQRGNVNVTLSRSSVASGAFSVLQSAYRKSRAASRLQAFCCLFRRDSRSDRFSFLLPSLKETKRSREKHANGTAESGVFFLPSLHEREKCASRSFSLSHFDTLKLTPLETAKLII